MTTPIESKMSCAEFGDALADFLEHEVDEPTRVGLDAHAATCGECGPLLADLRKLRADAANLPALVPSRDLWSNIAARIETPVVELRNGGAVERWNGGTVKQRRFSPMWAGVAAAALVAATATVTHQVTKSTIAVRAPGVTAAQPTGQPLDPQAISASVTAPPLDRSTASPDSSRSAATPLGLASNKPTAEETFDFEIKRLRAIVTARRSALDTATVNVIERNLKVIDEAIAQCRAALVKDPASRFLLESLNDALDTKVHLLRTAAMLPARS